MDFGDARLKHEKDTLNKDAQNQSLPCCRVMYSSPVGTILEVSQEIQGKQSLTEKKDIIFVRVYVYHKDRSIATTCPCKPITTPKQKLSELRPKPFFFPTISDGKSSSYKLASMSIKVARCCWISFLTASVGSI